MSTMRQDPLLLGVVLIVGAMLYSRSMKAQAATAAPAVTGVKSIPGNVGAGTNQIISGAIGALFQGWRQMNQPTQATVLDPYYRDTSVPLQDVALSNVDLNAPGVDVFGDRVVFVDP